MIIQEGSSVTLSNSSILRNYSIVRGGGIGLRDSSYLAISNSTISYNRLSNYNEDKIGGGIHAYSSDSLIVTNCILSDNIAGPLVGNNSKGGAIGIEPFGGGGYVNISECTFLDNAVDRYGGAIYLNDCQAILANNHFQGNSTAEFGAAIYVENCNLSISRDNFSQNKPGNRIYGVVYVGDNSSATMDHCNFYDNGGSIADFIFWLAGSGSLTMKNTIFSQHPLAIDMYFNPGSSVSIEYSDFYNSGSNFYGSIPTGLGIISGVNVNGDSCDVFKNIYLDPLFINPLNNDFHFQATSPCIDTGDPSSPLDPDSSISDIGALYYHYLRGDANHDGNVSLSDIVYLISYLFKFGPAPAPIQSGDVNCDGKVSLSDIV